MSVVNLVALLALAEVAVPKLVLAGVPDLSRHRGWTEFVKRHTPDGKGIAFLPFPPGTTAADFDSAARSHENTLHCGPQHLPGFHP